MCTFVSEKAQNEEHRVELVVLGVQGEDILCIGEYLE